MPRHTPCTRATARKRKPRRRARPSSSWSRCPACAARARLRWRMRRHLARCDMPRVQRWIVMTARSRLKRACTPARRAARRVSVGRASAPSAVVTITSSDSSCSPCFFSGRTRPRPSARFSSARIWRLARASARAHTPTLSARACACALSAARALASRATSGSTCSPKSSCTSSACSTTVPSRSASSSSRPPCAALQRSLTNSSSPAPMASLRVRAASSVGGATCSAANHAWLAAMWKRSRPWPSKARST